MNRVKNQMMRFAQIEQYLASGQSVCEWCKNNNISTTSFYKWLNRYQANQDKDNQTNSSWIEITKDDIEQCVADASSNNCEQDTFDRYHTSAANCNTKVLPAICIHIKDIDIDVYPNISKVDILSTLEAVISL